MSAQPTPLAEFRPLDHDALTVTAVADLSAEQLALIVAPFSPLEKPKSIFTAQTFNVTCDLSGVTLPEAWLLRAYVWVVGSAAQLAPISYNPTPPKFLKSKLWRLEGGEAKDANVVTVSLPQAYGIARIAVECRGLFDVSQVFVPIP